jgi:methionyl-tRNA formyltransferase
MRLAFMGTPDFAVPTLDALVAAGHDLAAVYTQPPRPAGRGGKQRRSPVHERAEALGLPVRTPASLKDPAEQQAFADLALDAGVVAAYGLILPRPILDAPRLGCVNVHASLLPRWRGAAPIQRAILAGDAETGVTIMQMAPGLDTGPMLMTGRVPITAETTAGTLHDRLAAFGAELIGPALDGLAAGTLTPVPQPEDGVTYAAKLTPDDERLVFADPAETDRRVRALAPRPGAHATWQGERLKILAVTPLPGHPTGGAAAGTVLDDALTVACAEGGAVRLDRLQRPGKPPRAAADFLRGTAVPPGTVLGAE